MTAWILVGVAEVALISAFLVYLWFSPRCKVDCYPQPARPAFYPRQKAAKMVTIGLVGTGVIALAAALAAVVARLLA